MANSHSTRRPRKGLLLLTTLALAAVALSANAPTANAVGCKVKTDAPSAVDPTTSSASFDDYSEDDETIPLDDDYNDGAGTTPSDASVDEYPGDTETTPSDASVDEYSGDTEEYDEVGAENEEAVIGATPATKTPKPKKTKKVKTPKPSKKPKATKAPKATTAPVVAPEVENDATSAPAPVPSKTTTAPTPAVTKAPTPALTKAPTPAVTKAPTPAAAGNATLPSSSGGKCVVGDPTQYISKQYVDWIWENRMKPHYNFNNFIFDQLMTNKGKLSYCIRWDSTNKLPKATASKFKAMLDRQYAQWNKWLTGYGCWPFTKIEIEMVGVAVRDKALLDWTDDSLGPIYEKVLDGDGIPMCPEACYKHRNFEKSSDTSACKGKPFDISLWPTLGQGGGAGGDWGQRVDEANMLSLLDSESSVIVAHEIGHGFGLPDFYQPSEKPGADMPKMIMEAGASMSVTEGDGWLIRRGWESVRSRWPETSG